MKRISINVLILTASIIVLILSMIPLRRAESSEFEWMFAFGMMILSVVGTLFSMGALVVNIVRNLRKPDGANNNPSALSVPITLSHHGHYPDGFISISDNRLPRSEFSKKWHQRRDEVTTYEENLEAGYAQGAQAVHRLSPHGEITSTRPKKFWGFTNSGGDNQPR
jgi:hypothetical protein